jgi:hypothetical protein
MFLFLTLAINLLSLGEFTVNLSSAIYASNKSLVKSTKSVTLFVQPLGLLSPSAP